MVTTTSNVDIIIHLNISLNPAISDVEMNANPITLQRRAGPILINTILNIRILRIITMRITIQYSMVAVVISPIFQNIMLFQLNIYLIDTYSQLIQLGTFTLLDSKPAFSITNNTQSQIV